jgi:transcriptional regulator with XRE-family HTH domain
MSSDFIRFLDKNLIESTSPGTRLREIRKFFDLNQEEFCQFVGINRQNYLSRYENDTHEFDDNLKLRLVKVIEEKYKKRISLDWLITGNGDMFLQEKGDSNPISNEIYAISDYKKALEKHIHSLETHLKCAEQVYKVLKGHGFISDNPD